jgi:hypothetical protein
LEEKFYPRVNNTPSFVKYILPKFEGKSLDYFTDPNFERIVPSKTTLWRADAIMSEGEMGAKYRKALFDIAQKKRAIEPSKEQK